MNKHEIQTVKQEAQRFIKGIRITAVDENVKLELPFTNAQGEGLYFFITKRKGAKKFSLLIPVQSIGIFPSHSTLILLQPLLHTYGLMLSQDAVIMEESNKPLNQRVRTLAQAIIGIDGIRRLWKVSKGQNDATESENTQPISNSPNDSTSR